MDETPTTREGLETGTEYASAWHDVGAVVDLLERGDRLRIVRTSGRPAPSRLRVTTVTDHGVECVSDRARPWVLRPDGPGAAAAVESDRGGSEVRSVSLVELS